MTNTNIETATVESLPVAQPFFYITEWLPTNEAKEKMEALINAGTYKKEQIKKSSPRFANGKNKDDGYQVRLCGEAGINPEMEIAPVGYRKMIEKKVRHNLNEEQKALVAKFKKMLAFENIKEISETCIKLNDGSRLQFFAKKG